jgi:very-short-patch-repair endonuclease
VAQDRATGLIVALIEVDDWSHNPFKDRVRDEMTAYAGYRTIRVPGRVQPNFNDVMPIVASLRPLPAQNLPRHEVM